MASGSPAAIVTLTTDFGLADHYVAVVKGVILARAPSSRLVDLSHLVPAGAVATGAYLLWAACRWFPPGTIHLAVIDPGVGSARRHLAARIGEALYVCPDNGLLTYVARGASVEAFAIDADRLGSSGRSQTFHGRDVFAPAAAALAAGAAPADLGPRAEAIVLLPVPPPRADGNRHIGHVLHVDHYGNIVTDLALPHEGLRPGFALRLGESAVTAFASHYAAAAPGAPFVLVGSNGTLEISIAGASAAARLGVTLLGEVVLDLH